MTNRLKDERLEQMERGKDKMCRQKAKRNERMDKDLDIKSNQIYIFVSS